MTPLPDPSTAKTVGAGAGGTSGTVDSGGGSLKFLLWVVPLLLLSAGAVTWVVVHSGSDQREPETVEIIVPAGTQDRMAAGEKVVVMPTRLEFRVGDRILIRNEDDVTQSVGPYEVDAGEELLLQYGAPGVYEGYCPLSEGERYEIVVTT